MPRKPIKTQDTTISAPKETIEVEPLSFPEQVRHIWHDPRTRNICGVLLLALAAFTTFAVISFFFTGKSDYSLLDTIVSDADSAKNARDGIRNLLGLPGARLSRWLLDGTFGLPSVLFIVMLVLYGLRLLSVRVHAGLRLFFHSTFWILWGAITLGFLQLLFQWNLFFRLGGVFGEWVATWLNSYIHPLGMILSILSVFIIFMILTDADFIPSVQARWQQLMAHFKKAEPVPEVVEVVGGTTSSEDETIGEITIDLPVDNPSSDNGTQDTDTISVEINPLPVEEEEPTDSETPASDTEEEMPSADGDADLDVKETQEVELVEQQEPFDPHKDLEYYKYPTLDLLKVYDNETAPVINQEEQQANANRIVTTLRNYGIEIERIQATVGPTVTLYEVVPKAGIRINKIQSLESDIMLSLSAKGIRIIAPMPGKGTVGIEVPNEKPQIVSMHSVVASKRFQEEQKMKLPVVIGRTITNDVFMFDLAKTPHLLVAGATGQGKSVAINAILTSLLYKKHPSELKMVLVDPKKVEFAPYRSLIRHYLASMPDVEDRDVIITDCQKVVNTLNSLVIEMENRYELLEDAGVRNLEDYNNKFINRQLNPAKVVAGSLHHQYLPYIVIVIDEYGDFIMQAGKQVETPIARITQKARAVGMHMILATQRPSVNIVTGVIKANIPTRIALRTQSVVDSRTVLDAKGADQLIGKGDMLYSGGDGLTRIQCAFVDTPEVDRIVEHISQQQRYSAPYPLPEYIPEGGEGEPVQPGSVDMRRLDPMFADVARYVVNKQEGSTSRLQRAFEIGYNRAGKLSDQLEAAGIVGPNKGPKGRDVLIQDPNQLEELLATLGV